jgi:hypothetical protein
MTTATATKTATATATANLFNQLETYQAIVKAANGLLAYYSNEKDAEITECFLNSENELTLTVEYTDFCASDWDDEPSLCVVTLIYVFNRNELLSFDTANITESKLWKHRRF